MQTRGLGERGLVFAKRLRDAKMMRRRERGVLLVGIAVFMLWSSPTTAQPGLPAVPKIAPSQSAITTVTLLLENDNANGAVFGGLATGAGGFGVVGLASDTSSRNFGVAGATQSSTGTGVYGVALGTSCPSVSPPVSLGQTCVGVVGQTTSSSGIGVLGLAPAGGLAGNFNGGVLISGNLSVSGVVSGNGSGLTNVLLTQLLGNFEGGRGR